MRRRTSLLALLLCCIVSAAVYYVTRPNAAKTINGTVADLGRTFNEAWGGHGSGDGTSSSPTTHPSITPLNDWDARFVLRAKFVLETTSNGSTADIPNRPEIQSLVQAAIEKHSPEDEAAVRADLHLGSISANERETLRKTAASALMDAATRAQEASLASSLEIQVQAEARLSVVVENLRRAAGDAISVPQDPLGVLPTRTLQNMVTAQKESRRALASFYALTGASAGPRLDLVDDYIARILQIIDSPEHKTFMAAQSTGLPKISKHVWDTACVDADARTAAAIKRATARLQATTGWVELAYSSQPVRGPPPSVDSLLWQVSRDFDVDPMGWLDATSRLKSLADHLPLPGDFDIEGINRTLVLADNATLNSCSRLLDTVLRNSPEVPEAKLFPDKNQRLSSLLDGMRKEIERRKSGGARLDVAFTPEVQKAVFMYVESEELTRSGRARFLSEMAVRYPQQEYRPAAARQRLDSIYNETLDDYAERTGGLLKAYRGIQDQLALSTMGVQADLLKEHAQVTQDLAGLSIEVHTYISDLTVSAVHVKPQRKEFTLLFTLFPPRGPPPPAPEDPGPSVNPKPPKPGPGPRHEKYLADPYARQSDLIDPSLPGLANSKLERRIFTINKQLSALEQSLTDAAGKAASIDVSPPAFAMEKGRRTLKSIDIVATGGVPSWRNMQQDMTIARLPKADANWAGRLKDDGAGHHVPFDYESEVKSARSFKAVGGGIHMGEVAHPKNALDATKLVLKYDRAHGLYFADNSRLDDDKILMVDRTIEPLPLKALYRFASANRNAAISVGWGSGPQTLEEQFVASDQRHGSPVYLDPFLVDTPVGQDLILADSVPWEFDKPLPNGKQLSFCKDFGNLHSAFQVSQIKVLGPLFDNLPAFSDQTRDQWAGLLNGTDVPSFLEAMVRFSQQPAARKWYINREIQLQLVAAKFPVSDNSHAQAALGRFLEKEILTRNGLTSLSELTSEGQLKLKTIVKQEVDAARAQIGGKFDSSVKDISTPQQTRSLMLLFTTYVIAEDVAKGKCPRSVAQLWLALANDPVRKLSQKDLSDGLLGILNSTTLTLLYDDRVIFFVDGETVPVEAVMRYRYATSTLTLTDREIIRGAPENPENEVQTIESLTTLVNSHVPEVIATYAPIARVKHYAEITALLKWAVNARNQGKLAGIDFTDLATTAANDRQNSPTADAIGR